MFSISHPLNFVLAWSFASGCITWKVDANTGSCSQPQTGPFDCICCAVVFSNILMQLTSQKLGFDELLFLLTHYLINIT